MTSGHSYWYQRLPNPRAKWKRALDTSSLLEHAFTSNRLFVCRGGLCSIIVIRRIQTTTCWYSKETWSTGSTHFKIRLKSYLDWFAVIMLNYFLLVAPVPRFLFAFYFCFFLRLLTNNNMYYSFDFVEDMKSDWTRLIESIAWNLKLCFFLLHYR